MSTLSTADERAKLLAAKDRICDALNDPDRQDGVGLVYRLEMVETRLYELDNPGFTLTENGQRVPCRVIPGESP